MTTRREKRKVTKNPPVTRYNLDPTTPVHRQSLATTPAMVENRQPESTPQIRYAIPDQPQRPEPSLNRNKSEHKGQSDWLIGFCHHPVGDHNTVFAGIFAPCALYGKTHWRLKNVSLGRDPHDFKPSDGFGLTVIQRARIRAQYRIAGSVGDDVVKALFCGPCAMMQHDREVRAREGDVGLVKSSDQMSQTQPKSPQPMKYPLPRATSAEDPGVESRIFKQEPSQKVQKRSAKSELKEIPAEAILSAGELSSQYTRENEMEAVSNLIFMQNHRNTINAVNASAGVGNVDGSSSSNQRTRVGCNRDSLASLTNCSTFVGELDSSGSSEDEDDLKGCEKLSRMPARGHLSYVHDFSDCSATMTVLDHYAEEERAFREDGTIRCLVHSGETNPNKPALNVVTTRSTRSSSSSTIRQHTSQEDAVETLCSEPVNQNRISSYSVVPRKSSSIRDSLRQNRLASCPTIPGMSTLGTSASSVKKDRMLNCTVETAPPSSSSSSVMQYDISNCKSDIMDDSNPSTPLMQYSQYCHLLDESTLVFDSPISRSPSKSRAFSCTALSPVAAREQHPLADCFNVSGDLSPASVKQHRVSSCCASIPSGSINTNEGYGSHMLDDCNFTTESSTPIPKKQHRLTSCTVDDSSSSRKSSSAMAYLMEDGCLLSGAASPFTQHRVASCGEISSASSGRASGGNLIDMKNEFEDGCMSSGSSTPKIRQHRAVSCIAPSTIAECAEHLLDDCEYDSNLASPLLQHNITGCDTTSVAEEEKGRWLEDCAADSSPSTPLRQHRIASCVVSSLSSNRDSVVEQHRFVSCPGIIPDESSRSPDRSHDSHHLSHGILVDTSENDQSTHTNYEDCLHNLDECITPADKGKMEAHASRNTEYEKYSMKVAHHFHDQAIEFNEKSAQGEETRRSESDSQPTLAQFLSVDEENNLRSVTQIDGDGTMSIASRSSIVPPTPYSSPAAPYSPPATPLNICGAYPFTPITPLNINKDKKRIPSEQDSAGSGFASYFGFGSSKKTQGLVNGVGGSSIKRGGIGSLSRGRNLVLDESVPVEEVELDEILFRAKGRGWK
ncbi:hypothetical protein SBOR_3565 [Sclerotinia borealis F-4128]|uniref:Uncharacterized protein n=1 Tax=Sclerotinia borealis (strain F-4128) TaxID=1432307 RepID=W9CJ99_SCLBF|nr:hypothetical protein SBOR_3565 [Sclerotinia borealis F-4128]